MRVLAVDIGTNSTLHLIADVAGNNLMLIERGISGNKLGVGLAADRRIPPDIRELNRRLLDDIVRRAAELGCRRMAAVGTQALREAVNRDELLDYARELGLEIRILTPAAEALLGWRGVFSPQGTHRPTVLLDLGGGSCQLTTGRGAEPGESFSIPLGAVTLTRKFFASDPPDAGEEAAARQAVANALQGQRVREGAETQVVGIGGTITALAALELKLVDYEPGALEGEILTSSGVIQWRERLMAMGQEERERLPGMPPARAHSIHGGALILEQIMQLWGWEQVMVSERGVMFGLAYEMFQP